MLEHVGLGPQDERVYRAVLERPGTADEIAARAGADPVEVVGTLRRLADLQLAGPADASNGHWVALPADTALARLHEERTTALERERAELERGRARLAEFLLTVPQYGSDTAHHLVEVVDGTERVGARVYQVVETARETIRVLDRPPYVYNAPETGGTLDQERRLLARGVSWRVLYDAATFSPPELSECLAASLEAGEQARVMRDVPVKLCIADDEVAILPLVPGPGQHGRAVVLHTPVMVQPIIALFESLWQRAVPVGGSDGVEDAPSADEKVLLMLLAAGMKDGAIARHLRISERTTNRRISELAERLNAHTRFQAGLQAARRGWL
jgi:DNA-binding CsgD family transcriptional regulator/sugar-specific transcriptional regulator TrmB